MPATRRLGHGDVRVDPGRNTETKVRHRWGEADRPGPVPDASHLFPKAGYIVRLPRCGAHLVRIAVSLACYFLDVVCHVRRQGPEAKYARCIALPSQPQTNGFELAIAVAVALFGVVSNQAFATVIGPLLEVSVLIRLGRCGF